MVEYLHKDDFRFGQVIPAVLNVEGGYVDHPKDPGGPTNHGIAYNYNVAILRELFGINTAAEIKNLTVPQAKEIYYRKYWMPPRIDSILDTAYAYIAFDASVNQGPGTAKQWINSQSKTYQGDGKNINLYRSLRTQIIRSRNYRYSKSSKWDTFGWGWMNRMCEVSTFAERVAQTCGGSQKFLLFGGYNIPLDDCPVFPEEYLAVQYRYE